MTLAKVINDKVTLYPCDYCPLYRDHQVLPFIALEAFKEVAHDNEMPLLLIERNHPSIPSLFHSHYPSIHSITPSSIHPHYLSTF